MCTYGGQGDEGITGAFRSNESELKNTELSNVLFWVHCGSIMSKILDLGTAIPKRIFLTKEKDFGNYPV
jgi:hypothetical protein